MKIYTRTGDGGQTGLFGGGRVGKDDARVQAYGDVDELNSAIGLAIVHAQAAGIADVAEGLLRVQADLFTVGANLATPRPEEGGRAGAHVPELRDGSIDELERWIDASEEELPPLTSFVLPGGSPTAAALHLCRTVCRRAERNVVTLARTAIVGEEILRYLNRLSDLLFTLARLANVRAGVPDVPWIPNPR
ncbi:MAG TPA: cob(I)yrinic acid a,c-diamide adenosyltransferase [Longimicrobiaceae bacterium]|nr:cob(I)yrinic acid a,c-diamide adenosyltransferase [Longimicrobiaceae bacterium]